MKRRIKRTIIGGCIVLAVFALAGSIALFAVYQWAVGDLPELTRLGDYTPPRATTVLARDGSQVGVFYTEKRFVLPLSEMSVYLPRAVLAVEDAEFYQHKGINPIAIIRAFLVNLKTGKHTQGGSTITQQVVKRLLLSPERTYERKVKEAILAYRLEHYLSKDEILSIYLNQSFLGSNSYGVEAASRTYFAKHAKELTLAESALIAGLPQAPTAYNPYHNPQAARTRQLHVLNRMLELEWITESEYNQAVQEPMNFRPMQENLGTAGAWYLEEVRRRLIELLSEENAKALGIKLPVYGEQAVYELGLTVKTAMAPTAQLAAERALRKGLEDSDKRQGWRGPLAKIKPADLQEAIAKLTTTPDMLKDSKWVRGIVTKVTKNTATIRMGTLTGVISVKDLGWARKPDLTVSAARASKITDVRNVLAVGHEIHVSAEGTYDKKTKTFLPYNPDTVTPQTVIPLKLRQYPEIQGALVSIEAATGDVLAVSGGYNFYDSQFNRATQARRHPGSSFKPIVYSAALDSGFTPMTIVMDAPVVVVNNETDDMWRPGNFEKNFLGPLPLRTALMLSRNLCTIRVAQQIGIDAVIKRAQDLGIEAKFQRMLGISLGGVEVVPLNLAEAYTAFADKGLRADARFILSVSDADGNIVYESRPIKKQVITPQNACLMDYMLKQVINGGTGQRAKALKRPIAGKTGTSNDERDAWFFGFTPHVVTGVYVGYDQLRPMGRGETGATAALPIFVNYSKTAFEAYPPDDFELPPDGIEAAVVNARNGDAIPILNEEQANIFPPLFEKKSNAHQDNPTAPLVLADLMPPNFTSDTIKKILDQNPEAIIVPFYTGTAPTPQEEGKPSTDTTQQGETLLKGLF